MDSASCHLWRNAIRGNPTRYLHKRLNAIHACIVGLARYLQISLDATWLSIRSAAK